MIRAVLGFLLWSFVVVVALAGSLFRYFIYTPKPDAPHLSGALARGSIESGGRQRTYLTYLPRGLSEHAPLVVIMHGSGEDGARMRIDTGYAFDRLADAHGFAIVYPDGFEGYWNGCNIVGDYTANTLNIDDVAFLTALVDKLAGEIHADPARVFATGVSRGGHMALRLALEAPSRFRAVASVAANVPTTDNFKCRPSGRATSSVMIMNGTADPLNPFNGGDVNLFGMIARGTVLSSRASAEYFVALNGAARPPTSTESDVADGVGVERLTWRNSAPAEIELIALHGNGHALPQPFARAPRILGPTLKLNGAELIWTFFERQRAN